MKFTKAHAYGNDFLYVRREDAEGVALDALARTLCDRHTGVGADGLIVFEPTGDGAAMRLFNADGSRAEVSGNGVRALGALLLRGGARGPRVVVHTEAGDKPVEQVQDPSAGAGRPMLRTAMGLPRDLRQADLEAAGDSLSAVVMNFGNPQVVVLGALPGPERFQRMGRALERHPAFVEGTNVEFAQVEGPRTVRILIWERGVGPTASSGTGSCAALIAAAAFGGAGRDAEVIAPGGAQRVEWREDGVYLTGWAEILFDGTWLGQIPRTP